jgi:hypothetical protein
MSYQWGQRVKNYFHRKFLSLKIKSKEQRTALIIYPLSTRYKQVIHHFALVVTPELRGASPGQTATKNRTVLSSP